MSNEQGQTADIETEAGQVITTEDGKPITADPKVSKAEVPSSNLGSDMSGSLDAGGSLD